MKIEYKVLWIEDHPNEVQAAQESLAGFLSNLGFDLKVDARDTISQADIHALGDQLKIYNPYDLVVFDYDLGTGKATGAEIAEGLRQNIYTDMIFYSSKPVQAMREDLFDRHVDGVYAITRTELHEDATRIIEDQIKRICDLNSMRGVVLDEMSRIDKKLRNLLIVKFTALERQERDRQVARTSRRYKERSKASLRLSEMLNADNFADTVGNPLLMEYGCVRDRLDSIKAFEDLDGEVLDILNRMQRLRNELAHQEATLNEAEGRIYLEASQEYSSGFDHTQFISIRKELLKIARGIDSISRSRTTLTASDAVSATPSQDNAGEVTTA